MRRCKGLYRLLFAPVSWPWSSCRHEQDAQPRRAPSDRGALRADPGSLQPGTAAAQGRRRLLIWFLWQEATQATFSQRVLKYDGFWGKSSNKWTTESCPGPIFFYVSMSVLLRAIDSEVVFRLEMRAP